MQRQRQALRCLRLSQCPVIAGLFLGTEKYREHQFQQQVRTALKGLRADQAFKQQIQHTGFPVDGDILHQYPNIISDIKLTDFTGT